MDGVQGQYGVPDITGLADLYRAFFAMFADDAWSRLDRARLDTRKALAAALATPGSTVVECGAFLGHDTALLAAAVGPAGRLFVFDGCPVMAARRADALRMVREMHPTNLVAYDCPLYDGRGESIAVASSTERPGHTVVHHDAALAAGAVGGGQQLDAVSASSLDQLPEVRGAALLWLDTQGSAPFIVAGGRRLLSESRPAVVFEYAHTAALRVDAAWPLALFGEVDYTVYDFSGLPVTTAADIAELRCWNLIAYPSERPLPEAAVRALSAFRNALAPTRNPLRGAVGEEGHRLVELVSLRTAARAAGSLLGEKTLAAPVFDIFSRSSRPEPETIRVARFPRLGVVAGTAWKPFTPDGLYMEELGYTVKGGPDRVQHWQDFAGRWTIHTPPPLLEVAEDDRPVFILGGDGAYYHWILNWLPRMMVFDEFAGELGGVDRYRFLVSAGLGPACIRGLEMLGVGRDNLIVPPFESTVFTGDAVVPSFFSSNVVSPNVAAWYRRRLAPSPRRRDRRLYITRNDISPTGPPRRRVVNEPEVVALLQEFGFETVRLAELAFERQMQLFAEAAVVLGPHGAGFANLVFTPPGAQVLVLENAWNHTFMIDMARAVGHRADSLLCSDRIDEPYEAEFVRDGVLDPDIIRNRDMVVDVEALRSALKTLSD
jgi:hypothetical protein